MYQLTEEGLNYLKNGLPEVNLIKKLSKKELKFDEAKKLENFNIALQWAKKNEWIEIKDGILKLTDKGKKAIKEKYEIEELLKKAEKNKLSEDEAKILLKRNLVRKITEKEIKVKKLIGKEVVNLTPELLKTGYWRKVKFKPYNVEVPGKKIYPGKRQPYKKFLDEVKEKLINLGFKEMEPRIVVQEFWNCDALFMPQTHPARNIHDIFYVDLKSKEIEKKWIKNVKKEHEEGWRYKWDYKKAKRNVLISQGTALSALQLTNLEIPGKYFALVRVFRPDVVDATHLLEFYQFEGIVIDKNLNFRHLLGLLKKFAEDIAEAEEIKFYPDYYPFTEPSVQLSAKHKKLGWVEFGGAGIFRKEVTRPFGIKEPVIAWGIGIDRLAMFKLGLNDIRELYSQNLKWLRETFYYAKD
jgi:phenylalanyl-tRNA synthetase alpha chain